MLDVKRRFAVSLPDEEGRLPDSVQRSDLNVRGI